ncbi:hypothetical protein Tco_1235345 [Tanacetum coccineum]
MIKLLNEPMYMENTTLTIVPLFDTIHETQEDDSADQVMESPSAVAATITPPTKSKKKRANKLLKNAIQRKNDSKKAIRHNLEEQEK